MAKVTGRIFLNINGRTVRTMPGATIKMGGIERTPVVDDLGVVGFTEKWVACMVDFTIPHTAKVSAKAIQAMDNVSLIFRTDTGTEFPVDEAFSTTAPALQGGGLKCQFSGVTDRENLGA